MNGLAGDERGSILPLLAGYLALALAVVLVCVNGIDLLVTQRRIDSLADAAALAASDGFEIVPGPAGVTLELNPATAHDQAAEVVRVSPGSAWLVGVDLDGPTTARATVADLWEPKILGIVVPAGVVLTATGTSRASLAG
ncbi:hypothetical protein GCM10010922_20100 [Microbacterium sorbitolivorans]|uniref:Putative Flp pilus-assembly TadG-like N-terminal domain-containing protein n=1 Tax=Microbacterium sorbitolivorans TaxID=1867410 RepID=A0A367Y8K5_9MICO|nr:pilus assembly protein TadG-related protein [Microbacterium sorbitolivorans]RCK61940.1 hypothetical protein DTO57_04840 [Microbacterium sorbitolivorans]GGF44454.1 hypothetical protein GCM10010922_20100 [Microbacterium sorbitolivorans]